MRTKQVNNMDKIKYDGITYDGDHVTECVSLPNEMKLDDAITWVTKQNGTDGEDIRYYQRWWKG